MSTSAVRNDGTASAGSLHGIIHEDIDHNANACTDFFQYANGTWRQQHPIPSYMDRWSRRWESGEVNKEHVRDILTEMSSKQDWPAGSAQQLAGDYYAACMDEHAVNARGLAPVKPLLDEVAAIKSRADLQRSIGHLNDIGIAVPFALGSTQDPHDPTQVIAGIHWQALRLWLKRTPVHDHPSIPETRR